MSGTLNVFTVIITPFFWMTHSLNSQEPLDGGGEFFYLLVGLLAMLHGLPHAVLDVVLEHYRANLLQGRDDAGDLGEDIYAVSLLVHHPLHAPNLTLDPPDTLLEQLFVPGLYVTVGGSLRGGCLANLCRVHQFLLSLYLRPAQPQSVAHHRNRGERHRPRRENRVEETVLPEHRPQDLWHAPFGEERIEDARGHRDQGHVIGERPEQVLLDVPDCGLRKHDCPRHPAHVPRDERQVASLHGDVGACAYGNAYVGLHQGRRVVDAVADHAYPLALGLQPLDLGDLVFGSDLRHDAVYAELSRDRLGGTPVVASQHGNLKSHGVETPYRLAGAFTLHVRYREEANGLAIHRDKDGGLALSRQLLIPRGEAVLGDARLGEKAPADDENHAALDASADAAARDSLERLEFAERKSAVPGSPDNRLPKGMLAGPLGRRREPQELFLVHPI